MLFCAAAMENYRLEYQQGAKERRMHLVERPLHRFVNIIKKEANFAELG